MKTVTCDICGATTRENSKWATTVVEDYTLHSLTMDPIMIEDRQIDICDDCANKMLTWLKENVKQRDEVVR